MPRVGFAGQLTSMIRKMKAERQKHVDALRRIDNIFESLGIMTGLVEETPRRGRPPGKRGPGRPRKAERNGQAAPVRRGRKRRKFETSGADSVLAFVKDAGSQGRTTGEINRHWKSEGRAGNAYVTISQLVKAKQMKRKNMPGERGSRHTAV